MAGLIEDYRVTSVPQYQVELIQRIVIATELTMPDADLGALSRRIECVTDDQQWISHPRMLTDMRDVARSGRGVLYGMTGYAPSVVWFKPRSQEWMTYLTVIHEMCHVYNNKRGASHGARFRRLYHCALSHWIDITHNRYDLGRYEFALNETKRYHPTKFDSQMRRETGRNLTIAISTYRQVVAMVRTI